MFKSLYNKLFNNKRNEISFKQGLDLTGLPVITFNQGDKKINFILDTGANYNIIDKKYLEHLKYTLTTSNATVYGIEGNKQSVKECIMDLTYKNEIYSASFLINNMTNAFDRIKKEHGVIVHGILGNDFFTKYQYVLDFKELIAYSKR